MEKILLVASGDNIAKYAYQLQSELNFPPDFEIINLHMEQALYYVRGLLKKRKGILMSSLREGTPPSCCGMQKFQPPS